jgi:AcrR family transcriptional regulator
LKTHSAGELGATRERIRALARDLYVLRGYDGFSFGDIAKAIGTTRANIHHHFGSKHRLMEELIREFADDAMARIDAHWIDGDCRFLKRLSRQLDDLKSFYFRYNPRAGDRNVWSPLSRIRLDLQAIGKPARVALERVDRAYDRALRAALRKAVDGGELQPGTPIEDVARMLRMLLLSCAPMTQDTGSFDEVERLFGTVGRMVIDAWRPACSRPSTRPARDRN